MSENYEAYKETKQELPPDPATFSDDAISDEEENEDEETEDEGKPRYRIRHYKKYDIMIEECRKYVLAGKRLPKLHSRWIVNRYINEHNSTVQSILEHNRMVDELRELRAEVYKLRRQVQELTEEHKQS